MQLRPLIPLALTVLPLACAAGSGPPPAPAPRASSSAAPFAPPDAGERCAEEDAPDGAPFELFAASLPPESQGIVAFALARAGSSRSDDSGGALYVARASARGLVRVRRVTRGRPTTVLSPSISPDGRQVAYVREDGGTRAVAVAAADGSSERRLAVCAGACEDVIYGADGHVWFVDRSARDHAGLWRVPGTGGAAHRFSGEPSPGGLPWGACDLALSAPEKAGGLLTLEVSNEADWPECAASGLAGIYDLAPGATALPARSVPSGGEAGARAAPVAAGSNVELVSAGKVLLRAKVPHELGADVAFVAPGPAAASGAACAPPPSVGDASPVPPLEPEGDAPSAADLPPEVHGRLVLSWGADRYGESGEDLFVVDVGPRGATGAPRKLLSAGGPQRALAAVSPDGREVIYVETDMAREPASVIRARSLEDSADRLVTPCTFFCDVAGVAKDGAVWFVDRSRPKIATVKWVPARGGAPRTWSGDPKGWWSCFVHASLDAARGELIFSVDNALGWPECTDQRVGLYTAPLGARGPGARILPRGHAKVGTRFERAWVEAGTERLAFDAWPEEGTTARTFTCARDGSDVRLAPDAGSDRWSVEVSGPRVVAVPPVRSGLSPRTILSGVAPWAQMLFAPARGR